MRGCPAVLAWSLICLLSSFLLPRTSGLVKPVSCFSSGATASPLLPTSAPARPLLPFSTGPGSPLFQSPAFQSQGSPLKGPELSLANVYVPLESIKPSKCWRQEVGLNSDSICRVCDQWILSMQRSLTAKGLLVKVFFKDCFHYVRMFVRLGVCLTGTTAVREGVRPETGITGSCEPSKVGSGSLDPLQEQQVLFWPFLQPTSASYSSCVILSLSSTPQGSTVWPHWLSTSRLALVVRLWRAFALPSHSFVTHSCRQCPSCDSL